MYDKNSVMLLQVFGYIILALISIIFLFVHSNKIDSVSLVDGWISSGYEIYIDGNPAINDYSAKQLVKHCRITGYPDEGKIICEIKYKASPFALDEALSQGYAVYIDGEKSEGISYTGEFLKKNYNVSINDVSRQIICVKKPVENYIPIYLPIPIRF